MAKEKSAADSVTTGTVKARVRAATRAGRLPPKNKSRLPRKDKKVLQTKARKAEKLAA